MIIFRICTFCALSLFIAGSAIAESHSEGGDFDVYDAIEKELQRTIEEQRNAEEKRKPLLVKCVTDKSVSFAGVDSPSKPTYIFRYESGAERLKKLQEGQRPISIDVTYSCRSDELQIYCERFDYGTYWTFQLVRSDGEFTEAIGEYVGDDVQAPSVLHKGYCSQYEPSAQQRFPQ